MASTADTRGIQALLTRREDQWFDRKGARIQLRDLADAIIGFANAEGGIIAVGISDGGKVEGLAKSDVNALRQASRAFTVPPVRHTFRTIPCVNSHSQADEIGIVEIEASEQVHHNPKDEVFLRVGGQTRKLTRFEVRELEFDKGQSVFDGTSWAFRHKCFTSRRSLAAPGASPHTRLRLPSPCRARRRFAC